MRLWAGVGGGVDADVDAMLRLDVLANGVAGHGGEVVTRREGEQGTSGICALLADSR